MRPRSIRARMLIWSAGLTLAALVLAWLALSAVLADFVNRRLGAKLTAASRGVMAAAGWDAAGGFTVHPPPADARFERPLSGWYWQVSDGARVLARSPGLVTGDLGSDGTAQTGPDGAALVAHVATFTAPGDGRRLTVTVALALAVLGTALLAVQIVAVRAGLVDLARFVRAVAAVRDGHATALPAAMAAELRPLSDELNRLSTANTAQMDRARARAGDLAHALNTPLTVLANRAGAEDVAMIDRMGRIIRWHLKRARAASAGLDPTAQVAVAPVLEDVAMVLAPEARRRGVVLRVDGTGAPGFRGDAEDLAEVVVALAENAVKWARTSVTILAATRAGGGLEISVIDDGPGIDEADRDRLLQRGARLDEMTPGHGLGLAIAVDRVAAYGGQLDLGQADGGGLVVTVGLPARA